MASPAGSHESGELGELPPEEMMVETATTTTTSMQHRLPPPPPLQQRDRGVGGDRRSNRSPPRRDAGGRERERGWDRERERGGGGGDGGRRRQDDGNVDLHHHYSRHRGRSRSRSREREIGGGGRDRGGGGGGDRRGSSGGGGRSNAASLLPPPPLPRSPTPPLDEDEAAAKLEAALAGGGGRNDEDDEEEAALLAARRARRAAILAKYKEQGPAEKKEEAETLPAAAAAPAPQPPPPAAEANALAAGTAEAELDADAAGASLFQHHTKAEEEEAAKAAAKAKKEKEAKKKETTPDIFAEDDLPEEAFAPTNQSKKGGKGLADAFDDPEGYYKFQVGERMGPSLSSLKGTARATTTTTTTTTTTAASSASALPSSASASASASASSSKDGRYEVFATHGKGVFSTVLRARDLASAIGNGTTAAGAAAAGMAANVEEKPESVTTSTTPTYSEVAIKVIRANELMRRAGALEASILEKLAAADPSGKRHCVRLLTQFDHRGHLCLVFEPLDSDLRALASRYGRGVGLSLAAARAYATQLLLALSHVASCGIVHADVKPDNVLVSKDRSRVVLADFGSALSVGGDNEVTPYLVSRFYRAPEIILGLRYSYPCDVWSLGCLLFELYTGKVAFPGKTNNEMLAMFQSLKGAIPKKMVKKGAFSGRHFELVSSTSSSSAGTAGGGNEQYAFAATRDDPISGRPMRTVVAHARVEADVAARLSNSNAMTFSTAEERADVAALADLLERMFALDPEKRITAKEALRHPFIARGLGGGQGQQQNGGGGGGRGR